MSTIKLGHATASPFDTLFPLHRLRIRISRLSSKTLYFFMNTAKSESDRHLDRAINA